MLEAIDGFPEGEREAFALVRIPGLTYAEAAEIVGVSAKTVQRLVNRARRSPGAARGFLRTIVRLSLLRGHPG